MLIINNSLNNIFVTPITKAVFKFISHPFDLFFLTLFVRKPQCHESDSVLTGFTRLSELSKQCIRKKNFISIHTYMDIHRYCNIDLFFF